MDKAAYHLGIERDGFTTCEDVIDDTVVQQLRASLSRLDDREEVRHRGGTYGIRNLLGLVPEVRELANSACLRELVTPVLGEKCFAVRATFFDKIPGANWKVAWHQDNMILVRERIDAPGFGPWSQKGGVWHVQPPRQVLENILALRIHLDDCGADNGALRVLPGSHCHGWLGDQIDHWKEKVAQVACEIAAGGVLVMRPLILHASSSAIAPRHRRVIHIEYAATPLPYGLQWHTKSTSASDVPAQRSS